MNFAPKSVSDDVPLSFEFGALTTAIDSVTITVTRESGFPDPSPFSILSGGPQILGTKVLQEVVGGVSGTRYRLSAIAVSGPSQYEVVAYLPVLDSRFAIS